MWTRRAKKVKKSRSSRWEEEWRQQRRDRSAGEEVVDSKLIVNLHQNRAGIHAYYILYQQYMNIERRKKYLYIYRSRLDDRDNSDANVGVNDDLKGASTYYQYFPLFLRQSKWIDVREKND